MPPKRKSEAALHKNKDKEKMTGFGIRLTRLHSKLSSSPPILKPCNMVSSPATFLACSGVKQPDLKGYPFSVYPRRFKQVDKSSKQIPDLVPDEDQELESQLQPLLNELMSCSKAEKGNKAMPDGPCIENRQSEGHCSSEPQLDFAAMTNNLTAPKSTPVVGVGAKTPEKTSNVPVDTANLTIPQSDNVLNSKDKDTMEGDVSCSAATFVGRTPVTVSNALVGRVEEGNADPTLSCGFTEIANMFGNDESSENEEEESPSSDKILGKYSVKEALAPMIRSMLEKHGDIAANYRLETPKGRSVALENLVEFIQEFKDKNFVDLNEKEIEKDLKHVSELGGVMGLEVGWLQIKLEAVLKARKTAKQSLLLKEKKDKVNQLIKDRKRSLESKKEGLKAKKRSVEIIEEEIKEKKRSLEIIKEELKEEKRSHDITKEELSVALAEAQRLKATTDEVKYYVENPPFGDLF